MIALRKFTCKHLPGKFVFKSVNYFIYGKYRSGHAWILESINISVRNIHD